LVAYTLDLESDLATAVRNTARDQLESGARTLVEESAEDPVEAVHDARKNVKKSRALLRLVRPALDRRTYRRENRTLRDAARTVAHVRDADVMVETVDALRERFVGQRPEAVFDALRAHFEQRAEAARPGPNAELGAELVEALRDVAARVDDWPLDAADWPLAVKGAQRAYARGRSAFAVADADPTVENLHEWRKRVKDLWYHDRLLKPAWPGLLDAQAKEAHTLSDLLGDDHDLSVLTERLRDDPPTVDVDDVLELIEQRRAELMAQARSLGRRVYAEKPKAFARRLRRYLEAAAAREPAPA
jgi:CHAD domain-containing protein